MISLIIAEDQLMLRKAMVQLIELNEEMKVLKDVENGKEALQFIENENQMWLYLDIEIPGMTGLEILAQIRAKGLNTKVIIVTTFEATRLF